MSKAGLKRNTSYSYPKNSVIGSTWLRPCIDGFICLSGGSHKWRWKDSNRRSDAANKQEKKADEPSNKQEGWIDQERNSAQSTDRENGPGFGLLGGAYYITKRPRSRSLLSPKSVPSQCSVRPPHSFDQSWSRSSIWIAPALRIRFSSDSNRPCPIHNKRPLNHTSF